MKVAQAKLFAMKITMKLALKATNAAKIKRNNICNNHKKGH
jgi:hypothetical protein